jgi:outer membrane protein TolC
MQLPIFDGGKTRVAMDEKKLEIARLLTERDKRLWDLRSDFEKSATAANLYSVELNTKAELVSSSKNQLTMVMRLTESQVMEKTKAITEQIDLAKRQFAEDITRTKSLAAAKRLRIYSEIASK